MEQIIIAFFRPEVNSEMIEVRVKKKIGDFLLDAELKDEGFICLTGKNGSGKSSLLSVIAGIYQMDEGYIKINSETITEEPLEKRQVVLVTQDSYIPHLEVSKHLILGAKLRKKKVEDDLISEMERKLGINYSGQISKLSLGMRERVSLATALLSYPKLILIDEAFANLDNRIEFINSYRDFALSWACWVIVITLNPSLGIFSHLQ